MKRIYQEQNDKRAAKAAERENRMKGIRKQARRKIKEVNGALEKFNTKPQTFTYVTLYHTLEELYFQKKYNLASSICDAILDDVNSN